MDAREEGDFGTSGINQQRTLVGMGPLSVLTGGIMTLTQLLAEKGKPVTLKANNIAIPVLALDNTTAGAHEFNTYYREVLSYTGWNTINRTKSGGISIARSKFRPPMWDVRASNAVIELTIISTKMIRIQFRQTSSVLKEEGPQIYGRQAFSMWKKELRKDGIYLEDYEIENGVEVKKTIPKYLIKMERDSAIDLTFTGCHHIDFHNSFPAGLANTYPEFRKTVERLYLGRKVHAEYKAILNYSIGFMQSVDNCGARWAHLSKDAITDNNARVEELANRLKRSGRMVIAYNTDGIWYKGDIYHGAGEGKSLGEWENDHTNCQFRMKSKGAYEFIENGKYYPVVRGRTNYDLIKPREEWEWGDIYRKEANPIQFYWTEGYGITDMDENIL